MKGDFAGRINKDFKHKKYIKKITNNNKIYINKKKGIKR